MKLSSVANARLAGGGDRVAWGAGLFALGGFADRVGLTGALSAAVPRRGERAPVHDRGVLLVHLLLVLAGGGEACTDIEHLRSQRDLFGAVGSHSTLYRALRGINGSGLGALWGAAAKARGEAWPKRRAGGPLVVDIDSTLVEVHSENKQGAAPHYKGGYGFGPMICSTGDGEPLWAKLRPGNAAANDIADHIEVLDAAISVLPDADAAGHREGDDAALVGREMVLRVDAGGCSARIAAACRDRNITFFMSARATAGIDAAIAAARCDPRRWSAAVANPTQRRSKAHVAELTDLVDLSGWPARTRLIVRREPRHPGAQRSLFDSDNFRLLGIPHRRHSRPCPARPRDEKARRRRGRRRAPQGLRAGAHALHSLGRQLRMGSAVHHQRRARALVPDTLPHRASQTRGAQTAPLDAVAPARARVRDRPTRQAAAPHRTPRRQSPARRPASQPGTTRPQPNITARTTRAAPPRPHTHVKNQHRPCNHPNSAKQHPPGPAKPTNPPRTPKTQPKTPIRHSHEQSGLGALCRFAWRNRHLR